MISAHDRGFQYGDGVFETARCRNGKLLLWELHRDRLFRSCATLAIPLQFNVIDQSVSEALRHVPSDDCILKIIVTRGVGGRGYAPPKMAEPTIILQWHELPAGFEKSAQQDIDCIYCDHPLSVNSATAGIKHLNRLDQVMASLQLSQAAADFPEIREGLMSDAQGNIVEGTRSNIFAVISNTLCTPDLSLAGVEGVMRSFLIARMNALGFPVKIRHIQKKELSLASELFVCNSVFGVWPVARILHLVNHTANVEVQFPSRKMADVARKSVQEVFSI